MGEEAYFVSRKEKSGRQQFKRILEGLNVCLFLHFEKGVLCRRRQKAMVFQLVLHFTCRNESCLKGIQAAALFNAVAVKGSWGRLVRRWKGMSIIIFLRFDPIRHSRRRSSAAVYLHPREESDLLSLIYPVVMSLIMFPSESTKASQ